MNLFVIINSKNQDQTLGIEIDRVMKKFNWILIPDFPYTYTKEVKNENTDYLKTVVRQEVAMATDAAEWSQVKFLYTISADRPQLEITR